MQDVAALSSPRTPGHPPAPRTRSEAEAAPGDSVVLGMTPQLTEFGTFRRMPGVENVAVTGLSTEQLACEAARRAVAEQLLAHLGRYPSMHAVVAMGTAPDGNTHLLVASHSDALSHSAPQGAAGLVARLASSDTIKAAAQLHPQGYAPPEPVDAAGRVQDIELPGSLSLETVGQALAEGLQPNRKDQLKALLDGLPKGQRAVILLGGPSGAGKTSLIKDLTELAGNRKVVPFLGDMYFRDVDDPNYPMTAQNTHNFDHPSAMHMDEMAKDIATLIQTGKADLPVYDFTASRPGGLFDKDGQPIVGITGVRTGTNHVELGGDDILVLDSLHATNPEVIGQLKSLGVDHNSIYLDTSSADVRLLRRIVRDYSQRLAAPQRSLDVWDLSTFPGEVNFVRPTLLDIDPARDLFYVTQFPADQNLSKAELQHKVDMQARYGLMPTYEAFATPDDGLADFARKEFDRFTAILAKADSAEKDKATATRGLQMLAAAPNPTVSGS